MCGRLVVAVLSSAHIMHVPYLNIWGDLREVRGHTQNPPWLLCR